jgi:hypothetical protein
MDKNFSAIFWEGIRVGLGIYIIFQQGDWFGASRFFEFIVPVLIFYFVLSFSATVFFAQQQRGKADRLSVA